MNKVYIIAEIGVNHDGKLALAKKMIKAAKKSGADAVKFQSFRTEEFMANKQIIYKYDKSKEKMYSMFQRLEFKNHWYNILSKYCKQIKIDFITSIADSESLKNYLKINPKFIKLSSEDLINYPLLKTLSKLKKTIIVSTGMADEIEIKIALNILKKNKIIILHCVSLYPTSLKNINLNRIISLKKFGFPVGFSDHTVGIKASIYAVLLGAKIIEKHFTINKNLKGPDHKISSDPKELSLLVKEVRLISKIIGDGEINPKNKEINIRKKFRRSIVASEKIKKNQIIKSSMLSLKRPGTGLHPIYLKKIIGSRSKYPFEKNQKFKI
jgi:sialic acid synthase SpsE